jgi:phage tail sheath protein FI
MAENFQAPGVTVRELRAGIPQIRGVPTSVGAMLGRTQKGWSTKAVRVDSFAKWARIYGSYDPNSYAAEGVEAFFKNGGSALWFGRILGTSAGGAANVKASVVLSSRGTRSNSHQLSRRSPWARCSRRRSQQLLRRPPS